MISLKVYTRGHLHITYIGIGWSFRKLHFYLLHVLNMSLRREYVRGSKKPPNTLKYVIDKCSPYICEYVSLFMMPHREFSLEQII